MNGRESVTAALILAVAAVYLAFGLRTASNTLGCDFLAYFNAAQRWLAMEPIYDLGVTSTGSCGTYQYPPPFVLLAAPFSLLGFDVGNWMWIGFLIGCWLLGTAILPLHAATRWIILLLGVVGWPMIFGVRIGQVGPILYLLFAIAWQNLDRPWPLGVTVALGGLVKLQPGLLLLWLAARRAWLPVIVTLVVGSLIAGLAWLVGLGDWLGLIALLRALTNAVTIPANLAIGATLHSFGVSESIAGLVQTLNTVVMVALVGIAGWKLPRTAGFLVAVVATQLISPIVWSHYALILLLPVGWLIDRRHWWATLIPAIQAWILIPFIAPWTYTVAFYATLAAVFVVGWRHRDATPVAHPSAVDARPSGGLERSIPP